MESYWRSRKIRFVLEDGGEQEIDAAEHYEADLELLASALLEHADEVRASLPEDRTESDRARREVEGLLQ